MPLTFTDYCKSKFLNEMAASNGDLDGKIMLDDEDREFVNQAVEAGIATGQDISEVGALRARYTFLLQDKTPDGGKCRFFGPGGRVKPPVVTIERTHLAH